MFLKNDVGHDEATCIVPPSHYRWSCKKCARNPYHQKTHVLTHKKIA